MYKLNIKNMLLLFVLLTVFWCIQMSAYNKEAKENANLVYQMMGEVNAGVSYEEAAANLLKGQEKPEAVKEGLKVFAEYGYGDDYETIFEERGKKYGLRLFAIYLVLYLFLVVVLYILQRRMEEKKREELYEIQGVVERFYNGDYKFEAESYEENTQGLLSMQLESLGQKLQLNEERLEREKEETKALVTDLSHQLKTPVASIQMSFQLLEDDNLKPEERKEFLNRLGGEINHLEGLLSALVNISRMESGMIHIHKEPFKIFETVVQAVNQVYMKAEKKGIEIEICNSSEEMENLTIPHDVKWTREALVNVLDNAIKYSPADSGIQIRLEKQLHFLRIEIQDEGVGIKKEEVNRIFQRFYRGRNEVVKQAEGSGVGLYLTRKILEEQGGNITVVFPMGKEEIQGTTFAIMLSLK